eukprot:1175414-Prorocentrum_minimum.AAC.4
MMKQTTTPITTCEGQRPVGLTIPGSTYTHRLDGGQMRRQKGGGINRSRKNTPTRAHAFRRIQDKYLFVISSRAAHLGGGAFLHGGDDTREDELPHQIYELVPPRVGAVHHEDEPHARDGQLLRLLSLGQLLLTLLLVCVPPVRMAVREYYL